MSQNNFLSNYRDNYWGTPKRRFVCIIGTIAIGMLLTFILFLLGVIKEFTWQSILGVIVGAAISIGLALLIKIRWPTNAQ